MNYSVDTDLLIKYFSGLAGPREALRIDEWRKAHPDHESWFGEFAAAWGADYNYEPPETGPLWKAFIAKNIPEKIPAKRKSRALKWLPYAAILILISGIALWQTGKNSKTESRVFAYSAASHQFDLKQGATVRLEPGALLQETVTGHDTLFTLQGSALFTFHSSFPGFRLRLPSGICLRDIGTKFRVEGDAGSARVTVYTGQIAAWYRADTVLVRKNEVLTFNKASGFKTADLTGNFDYKDYTLKQVCDSVGNYFNTDIQVAGSTLAGRMLTLKGEDLSLDQVLEIITETLDIKYEAFTKDTIVFQSN